MLNPIVPRAAITHPIARICTYLWQSRLVSNYHSQRRLRKKFVEFRTMTISPRRVYSQLRKIDQVDSMTSALYRELAQDVLATPGVSIAMKQAIAERLNQANRRLGLQTVGGEDSY